MNYEGIRNIKIITAANKMVLKLPYLRNIKGGAEIMYWRLKKWEEKHFSNDHFEYFFTSYFGLDKYFYSNKRVLDIGCGPRGSLEWADNTHEKYGLDPLATQYLKMHDIPQDMHYIEGVSENIPFADGFFDIVTTFNSLDHVDDLSRSIAEITRVLKPEGLCLLITDIHKDPTITEPSAFGWDIVGYFRDNFKILSEMHYEGHQLYKSIRKGIPFDHNNPKKRYGVLTAKFQRKSNDPNVSATSDGID